jgi:serine phosphatase RsbU (regulator of sigma subunit)
MPDAKHSAVFNTNRRGAFVLGALLVAVIVVAIAFAVRIYRQLDSAVSVQETLVSAQQELDRIATDQHDLQDGLRGYVATGDQEFLFPYRRVTDDFAETLEAFAVTTTNLDVAGMGPTIKEMSDLHQSWLTDVARPLLRDRHAADAKQRQTYGKVYVDQLRTDTSRIQKLLQDRLSETQAELKRRIDEALFGEISAILVFGLVSISFVTSRVQMQGVIERERTIVDTLGGAFRTAVDLLPGARVGTAYLSADRDAAVGGDLFDVRRLDSNRALLLVADVSGKGMEAAVNTAFVKYSIRTLARRLSDPAAILGEFNTIFLETVVDPNLFVVGFVGVLDERGHRLTYASAGHAGAYLRRGASVTQLDVTGPIVGLDVSFGYEHRQIALEDGDVLLVATDGLSEARTAAGELLGDDGAMRLLLAADMTDAQRGADDIVEQVRLRSGGALRDDLALLVIAIDGGSP